MIHASILNDFSVFGQKVEHLNDLKKCMTRCKNNGINFNPKKCAFCVKSGVLRRHIVCEDGPLVNPRKINIIKKMPTPTNVIKLKRFLGALSFYQRYFINFVIKVALMCKLLKKDTHYWWDNPYKESFQWMKTSLSTLLVFIIPY
jgi:hypothetical protein